MTFTQTHMHRHQHLHKSQSIDVTKERTHQIRHSVIYTISALHVNDFVVNCEKPLNEKRFTVQSAYVCVALFVNVLVMAYCLRVFVSDFAIDTRKTIYRSSFVRKRKSIHRRIKRAPRKNVARINFKRKLISLWQNLFN